MRSAAVLIRAAPRRTVVGEVEVAPLAASDALVECKAVGICRSDLELLDGALDEEFEIPDPLVFGHEWAGIVLETGSSVTHVQAGDHVTGAAALGPHQWLGLTHHGAAAERFVVPALQLYRLPDDFSFRRGALVEPFACGFNAILESGGTHGGELVVIVGGGAIGLCLVAATRAMGAVTVLLEPDERRRELAQRLGADITLDPTSVADLPRAVRDAAGVEDGADLVIEASGHPAALASAFRLPRFGGRITFMGLCDDPAVSAPIRLIQAHDLVIRGVTGAPRAVWAPALRFMARHRIDLTPIVTSQYQFGEAELAFAAARDTRHNVKVHIEP
jgi:2-desacetyl-2-hydroxyethyl bacteriochlorophyllide A dehydrogenase